MTTATHKQRVLARFCDLPKPLEVAEPEPRPVLEQLLYAVCREGVSRERADEAFHSLQSVFFDWNEIRVSSTREVQEALADLPDAETRAARVISLLQQVFESTYSFDLESLHKKGLKQAEKQLQRYDGANRYLVARALQLGLGGHALPLDGDMQRTLRRLNVLDGEADREDLSAGLEHLVPKARGALFCEALSALAHGYCHEKSPRCSICPLRDLCPTGQKNLAPKPRAAPRQRSLAGRSRGST